MRTADFFLSKSQSQGFAETGFFIWYKKTILLQGENFGRHIFFLLPGAQLYAL